MTKDEKQLLIYLARNVANILEALEKMYASSPLEEGWRNDKEALLKIIAKFAQDDKKDQSVHRFLAVPG